MDPHSRKAGRRPEALAAKATCSGLHGSASCREHAGAQGSALVQPRVLCGGKGWGAGAWGGGLEAGQHCLNVLGNGGHSAHSVY